MPKKKTHEQYVKEVESLNNGIKVVGTYVNNRTKILHKCLHGHRFEMNPNNVLFGQKCPYCSGRKVCFDNCLATINPELIHEWHPTKNSSLTPYDVTSKSNKKAWWKCSTCGHEWETKILSRSYGTNCPKCCTYGAESKSKSQEEFIKEIVGIYGENTYEFLTNYKNNRDKIKTKHKKCGYIWNVAPYVLLRNKVGNDVCPLCNCTIPYNTESFKERIFNLVGNEYTVVGVYVNDSTKIKMKHNKCCHEWDITPNKFVRGRRCPICRESKGEKRIREWLINNKIEFEPQMKYDELLGLNGGRLSYDFYLPQQELLIEYQGEYHDGTARNQSETDFQTQQEHDKRKRNYALQRNFNLLEIWYFGYENIELILNNYILKGDVKL